MGQRSQIYIRYTEMAKDQFSLDTTHLIASYYQWVYGERLVSRAAYGIRYILHRLETYNYFGGKYRKRLRRYFDVNFDMKDIQESININEEYLDREKEGGIGEREFNKFVFYNWDNDDGKLFIDITPDSHVCYAFTDENISKPMTASEYIKWGGYLDYHMEKLKEGSDEEKEYALELISNCYNNCKTIEDKAELMSDVQLEYFTKYNYVTNEG